MVIYFIHLVKIIVKEIQNPTFFQTLNRVLNIFYKLLRKDRHQQLFLLVRYINVAHYLKIALSFYKIAKLKNYPSSYTYLGILTFKNYQKIVGLIKIQKKEKNILKRP